MTKLSDLTQMPNGPLEVYQATSADPASIAAGAVGNVDIAITGLTASDEVLSVVPKALATGLVLVESVCATDKVTVTLFNPTASAVDDAASAYNLVILKQ